MTEFNSRPKLTDDAVSRLPLESGRAELLEEIMTAVAPDRQTEPTPIRTTRRSRWLVPLAVAAAVATLASSPLWWGGGGDQEGGPNVTYQPAAQSPGTGYRAVLAAPGWTVESTEQDSKYGGEINYRNGAQSLAITWYPEDTYQDYLTDREHIPYPDPPAPGEPVTVLGAAGQLWAYDANDHTVMREPDLGHWMEIRGTGMELTAYQDLLGQLRLVSLPEFESALPAAFVTGSDRPAAVQEILDGIEQASGATVPAGTTLDTRSEESDPYQLGADIAGQYACAWIADFADATAAGDQARADEAVRVMGTSRQWPILNQMEKTGEYSDVVWEYADRMAAGTVPEGYDEGLGCEVAGGVPSSQAS
jgi:hypothetical protein